jgi:hypothetical protein
VLSPLPRRIYGCLCRLLRRSHGLPRVSAGSASALWISRPAQASLALRPAGSLDRQKRPLSRGFGPSGCPSKPLVTENSCGINGVKCLPVGNHTIEFFAVLTTVSTLKRIVMGFCRRGAGYKNRLLQKLQGTMWPPEQRFGMRMRCRCTDRLWMFHAEKEMPEFDRERPTHAGNRCPECCL